MQCAAARAAHLLLNQRAAMRICPRAAPGRVAAPHLFTLLTCLPACCATLCCAAGPPEADGTLSGVGLDYHSLARQHVITEDTTTTALVHVKRKPLVLRAASTIFQVGGRRRASRASRVCCGVGGWMQQFLATVGPPPSSS